MISYEQISSNKMKAKRIQRKRIKGWKKPKNSIIVDRTSKWGNPFKLEGDMIYCDASHRRKILSPWVCFNEHLYSKEDGIMQVIDLYKNWVTGSMDDGQIVRPPLFTIEDIKDELRGKDLICFCPINTPCHADILLEIAN